jgi:hypothetical protein
MCKINAANMSYLLPWSLDPCSTRLINAKGGSSCMAKLYLCLNGVSHNFQHMWNCAQRFHHGETLSFSLLRVSCKKWNFADVALYLMCMKHSWNPIETSLKGIDARAKQWRRMRRDGRRHVQQEVRVRVWGRTAGAGEGESDPREAAPAWTPQFS